MPCGVFIAPTRSPPRSLRVSLLLLALACLPACSDGGGDGGGGGRAVDEPPGASLGGTLYATAGRVTDAFGVIIAISPDTGAAAVSSRARDDRRDDGTYLQEAEFLVGGSRLSPQIMYGINDCLEFEPPRGFSARSCIEIADAAGRGQRLLTLDTDLVKPPLMSPDGSMFVVEVQENSDSFGTRSLRLYTATGDLLDEARFLYVQSDDVRYDWTPDGRVVFGLNRAEQGAFIAIAARGTLSRERAFRVSTRSNAQIGKIAVSPDGASIAYDLWDREATPYRAFVLDIVSGESAPVADTPADMLVGRPTWSPDGRQLLVLHGDEAALSDSVSTGGSPPYLMLVDWPNDGVELDINEGLGRVVRVQSSDTHGDLVVPQSFSFNPTDDPRFHYWLHDSHFVWDE